MLIASLTVSLAQAPVPDTETGAFNPLVFGLQLAQEPDPQQRLQLIDGALDRLQAQTDPDPKVVLEEGAQIVADMKKKPIDMLGHVTSSYYSPNLKKSIALAVIKSGKNMKGKKLIIPMENKNIYVTVSDFIFLDKDNKRLNA